jgi:outer membrane protein OmpA-like peptidoglycan-associated protein
MKRFLTFIFTLSLIMNVFSENANFSKWSFTAEYGLNLVFGDYIPEVSKPIPPTYGLALESALTPTWGLSFDFYYFPYKGENSTKTALFVANLMNSDFNATINFTKMIFPNTQSKFSVNGCIGLGVADYKSKFTQPTPIGGLKYAIIDSVTPSKYAASIPVSFLIEYNLSKTLALGLRAHYRAYMSDNLEGAPYLNFKGTTNDYVSALTLSLRYKFNATKQDHLRNMTMKEFEHDDEALNMAKAASDKVNKLGVQLAKLEKRVDNHQRRLDSLQVFLSNDGVDSDGDGVPDQRDRSPNTPPNTPVDFWGVPIPAASLARNAQNEGDQNSLNQNGKYQTGKTGANGKTGTGKTGYGKAGASGKTGTGKTGANGMNGTDNTIYEPSGYDDVPSVYFEFDRINLDNEALEVIGKVAAKLKEDKGLMIEIRGYCDIVGQDTYNEKLSERRAERVKAEFVKMWDIDPDRIITNGHGRILEPRVKYRPNRRCDIFLSR